MGLGGPKLKFGRAKSKVWASQNLYSIGYIWASQKPGPERIRDF